ncbi:uncharacterized protein LOC134840525 isoform X3 [Symsagittifera roscoffensis]|uniref:uncharacterized protein LOC134840525 isoform X3 n=1 Tax=Symsagittifera roscoffensis TaxID=84072 RepID=UPI00307CA836
MQNFVSKCIQSLNNHRNLAAIDQRNFVPQDQCFGLDNRELSNVIGALPSRNRGSRRKEMRPGSTSVQPEDQKQQELDKMVNSLPTLTPCHSFPPNLNKRQLKQSVSARSNSDQNINFGTNSEHEVAQSEDDILRSVETSSTRSANPSRWVGAEYPEVLSGAGSRSSVDTANFKSAFSEMNHVGTIINWINAQTRKYIPYTVMAPPMHATVLIGGAEPPKKSTSKSKKSALKSSIQSAAAASGSAGGLKNWIVENLSRDMRDGTVFGILIEVLGGEEMEIDKSVYRLSEVSESDEAAMHNNISSILAFLQREGVDCMSINPQDVVGGDKETIMRLVLLIAAHYRPDQIQRQSHQNQSHVVTSNAQSGTSTPANFMIDPTSNQIFAQVTDINHQKFSAPDYQLSTTSSTSQFSPHLQSIVESGDPSPSNRQPPPTPSRMSTTSFFVQNHQNQNHHPLSMSQHPNSLHSHQMNRQLPPHRSASNAPTPLPNPNGHAMVNLNMSQLRNNDEQSLVESAPSLGPPSQSEQRLHLTKSDLNTLRVTLEYLQAHDSMMSQQGVVMTSRSVDTSGSAGMGGEDVNTRKILTQLQEMLILSQPPDGESETGDETEASSCGNSSGHQTSSTNQGKGSQSNGRSTFKARKRSQSHEKNAGNILGKGGGGSSSQKQMAANNEVLLNQLRTELYSSKQEWYNMQSAKKQLESRVVEAESVCRSVQGDYVTLQRLQQETQSQMIEMQKRLDQQDIQVRELNRKLAHKDKSLEQKRKALAEYQNRLRDAEEHKANLERENERRSLSVAHYQREVDELQHRLNKALKTKSTGANERPRRRHKSARSPSSRSKAPSDRGKELQKCLDNLDPENLEPSSKLFNVAGSEEYRMISSAVLDMKKNFGQDDPEFQSLEAIEQSLESLVDKLNSLKNITGTSKTTTTTDGESGEDNSPIEVVARSKFRTRPQGSESQNNPTPASCSTSKGGGQIGAMVRKSASEYTFKDTGGIHRSKNQQQTQVFYYTDNQTTPCITVIPKSVANVTLADFKKYTVDLAECKYLFKATDTEFGQVKEEISDDSSILPGNNNQITAWIERNNSNHT